MKNLDASIDSKAFIIFIISLFFVCVVCLVVLFYDSMDSKSFGGLVGLSFVCLFVCCLFACLLGLGGAPRHLQHLRPDFVLQGTSFALFVWLVGVGRFVFGFVCLCKSLRLFWLVGWLFGWVGWLFGWLVGWLVGW